MLMGFCTSPLRPASVSLDAILAESPGGMMFLSNSAVVHPQAGWTFLISRSAEPVFLRMNVCSTVSEASRLPKSKVASWHWICGAATSAAGVDRAAPISDKAKTKIVGMMGVYQR